MSFEVRPDQELPPSEESAERSVRAPELPPLIVPTDPCVRDDRCQMSTRCRHYGACRIAAVLFERTAGRRL